MAETQSPLKVDDMVATSGELAAKLGVSIKMFEVLAREGVAVRIGPGKYLVFASITNYITRLRRERANGQTGPARAALLMSQARIAEIKEATLKGERVHKDDVAATWGGFFRQLRALLLALPSRIGSQLPHLSRSDIAAIDREVRGFLVELSEYDPSNDVDSSYVPADSRPSTAIATESLD